MTCLARLAKPVESDAFELFDAMGSRQMPTNELLQETRPEPSVVGRDELVRLVNDDGMHGQASERGRGFLT